MYGGAPLVCPISRPDDNRYALNGISAWSLGCVDELAVYVNVAAARNFIDEQMRFIGFDTSSYTFSNSHLAIPANSEFGI